MPIRGNRIDQLPLTSGGLLEAEDLFHVLEATVGGGYINKKVSAIELLRYMQLSLSDVVLNKYGPLSGAVEIDLDVDSACEYTLNGDSSFSVVGTDPSFVKFNTSLLIAEEDLTISLDSDWLWVETRPINNELFIPSGNNMELVLRSSGDTVIAAYEYLA